MGAVRRPRPAGWPSPPQEWTTHELLSRWRHFRPGGLQKSWHEVSQCLADEYDEAAWATHDAAEYASAFRRARAAAALAFAHADAAGDCVYEAAHAFDLPHDFAVALRAALSR